MNNFLILVENKTVQAKLPCFPLAVKTIEVKLLGSCYLQLSSPKASSCDVLRIKPATRLPLPTFKLGTALF